MARLLIATGNAGKLREFRAQLADLPYELLSPDQLGLGAGPAETGSSYEENAFLKAAHAAHAARLPALADDSGLEVDALGGAPGIYSARFGNATTDGERIALLLRRLEGVPEERRGAAFVCALVLAMPNGAVHSFRGTCRGRILFGPRGEGGHGYDPVFWSPELGRTFAEANESEKATVSHRGRALASFRDWLRGDGGSVLGPDPSDTTSA